MSHQPTDEHLLTPNSYGQYLMVGLSQKQSFSDLVDDVARHAISNGSTNYSLDDGKPTRREFNLNIFGNHLQFVYKWFRYLGASKQPGWQLTIWLNGDGDEFGGTTNILEPIEQNFKEILFRKICRHLQTSEAMA